MVIVLFQLPEKLASAHTSNDLLLFGFISILWSFVAWRYFLKWMTALMYSSFQHEKIHEKILQGICVARGFDYGAGHSFCPHYSPIMYGTIYPLGSRAQNLGHMPTLMALCQQQYPLGSCTQNLGHRPTPMALCQQKYPLGSCAQNKGHRPAQYKN